MRCPIVSSMSWPQLSSSSLTSWTMDSMFASDLFIEDTLFSSVSVESIEEVTTSDSVVSVSASHPSTEAESRIVSDMKPKRPRGRPKTSQSEEQRQQRTKALNVMAANRYRRRKKEETISWHNRLVVEKNSNEWLRKKAFADNMWSSDVLSTLSANRDKIHLIVATVGATLTAIKLYDLYDNDLRMH
ncbi:unnamed protein product [Oppiella nova]|uniref:BZIP domain-containing protein n=1 Tax=Oppiella nova TaxID=334625 RepID=A0A7R9ME59_9ACAR|nr:unnamed protein product [Oppiella nova]CAG2175584.1 unnamed protein product [Oppiella nova]